MAKAPVVKFPRIEAGFYTVTLDGALAGYISKEVEDKETTWHVYATTEAFEEVLDLPASAIVESTDLFRVAKDFARGYFPENFTPLEDEVTDEADEADEVEVETVVLETPEWSEDEAGDDLFDGDGDNEFEALMTEELVEA